MCVGSVVWGVLFYGDPDDAYGDHVWAMPFAFMFSIAQFAVTTAWFVTYFLVQAPIHADVRPRNTPRPILSESSQSRDSANSELLPYQLPLPPVPQPDIGETNQERNSRYKQYLFASKYYFLYWVISLVTMLGGFGTKGGMHFLFTAFCVDFFRLPYGAIVRSAINQAGGLLLMVLAGWILIVTFLYVACVMFWMFMFVCFQYWVLDVLCVSRRCPAGHASPM